MRLENPNNEAKRARRCTECGGIATHSPDCSRGGRVVDCIPSGYDHSHLAGSPSRQREEGFDAAEFDGLLTPDDRILLRFGMHIAWCHKR
jgi:hypothetical protein